MAFGLSEFALSLWKRSRADARRADAGSLWIIWIVILGSWLLAVIVAYRVPSAHFHAGPAFSAAPFVLVAAGLALRWHSIVYLGRFFTVDVAIATGHSLIDTGPYRYIRHPAYSGALLAILGLGLLYRNWLSLLVMLAPTALAFLYRIRVEERVLRAGLGAPYADYVTRTKMLIPGIV